LEKHLDGLADERFVIHDQYVSLPASAFVYHGCKRAISVPAHLPPGLGVGHRFWAGCRVPFLENNRANARLLLTTDGHEWTRINTNSKFHVAAAFFQLITDLLDGLVGKLRRFLGDETGNLFSAQNLHV
jgi:hypothetical protein